MPMRGSITLMREKPTVAISTPESSGSTIPTSRSTRWPLFSSGRAARRCSTDSMLPLRSPARSIRPYTGSKSASS